MKYKFKELFCILCLVLFIMLSTAKTYTTYKSANEIGAELLPSMKLELIYEQDKLQLEKEFSCVLEDFDSAVYYACDEVMSVEELLIVKTKEGENARELVSQIEKRLDEKIALFENYAQIQADLLNNAIIETKGDFVIYCVGENAQTCYDEFKILVS